MKNFYAFFTISLHTWIRDKDAFKLPRKLDQSTNIALGLLHLIGEHSELSWYFGMIGFSNIFDTLLSRIQVHNYIFYEKTLISPYFFAETSHFLQIDYLPSLVDHYLKIAFRPHGSKD